MKNALIRNLALTLFTMSICAAPGFSKIKLVPPRIANYSLDIQLDTDQRQIKGKEIIEWTNSTETAAEELRFHIYWNGYQNNQSDFLSRVSDRNRNAARNFSNDDWGYCRIQSLQILENEFFQASDLTSDIQYLHPDNDNIFDQTVISVKLPTPVAPGVTARIGIDFSSRIPELISGIGTHRDFYFFALWFPKLGVFEGGQWNCHQYYGGSHTYSDTGSYDVNIRLPSRFKVGASGKLIEEIPHSDGTRSYHFFQTGVNDFAWAASPDFIKITEDYETDPNRTVEITLLLQPNHRKMQTRYMNAVKHALIGGSRTLGSYPYTTITCIDPAYNSGSGGLAFPTLFTAEDLHFNQSHTADLEKCVIRGAIHGWIFGIVAADHYQFSWMNEGLASFISNEIYYSAYGDPIYTSRYFGLMIPVNQVKIPIEAESISRLRQTSDMDIMQLPAWEYMNRDSYDANSTAKAELMIRSLQRTMGLDRFSEVLKSYFRENRHRHPRPQDFVTAASALAGQDMSRFLDQFLFSSGKLDYAVGNIFNKPAAELEGWVRGELITLEKKDRKNLQFESEVLVRRLGETTLPVEIMVVFENGRVIRETWDGRYRWKKFRYRSPVKVSRAVIDPEFKYVADVNRTNNSLTLKPNRKAAVKWAARWMTWLQHAMEMFALIGG